MSHTLDVHSSLQLARMDWQFIWLAVYSMIFPYSACHLPLFHALFSAFHISRFYNTQWPHILQTYDIVGVCDPYRPLNNIIGLCTQVWRGANATPTLFSTPPSLTTSSIICGAFLSSMLCVMCHIMLSLSTLSLLDSHIHRPACSRRAITILHAC